jgi:YegS/Rv2252/BmrU family lipid kinase
MKGLRIFVIVRPRAEEERMMRLREVVQRLRSEGHRVRVRLTFEPGDGTRFGREAARWRAGLVLVAGGDGTVSEVVNGIARSERPPRLAIVPFGTANDFATGLQLPPDPFDAVRVALEGETRLIDVGVVNRRCFINVSTGGFGAEATEEAPNDAKRKLGPFAYVLSGAKKLVEFQPYHARFRADGVVVHDGDFVFFAVGNARLTGGGTPIAPRAEFADGQLDAVIVGAVSRVEFLALLPDLRAGTHIESPDVSYLRVKRFEVEAPGPLAVNADGEPMRERRYRYRVLDRPLRLMVPPRTDG